MRCVHIDMLFIGGIRKVSHPWTDRSGDLMDVVFTCMKVVMIFSFSKLLCACGGHKCVMIGWFVSSLLDIRCACGLADSYLHCRTCGLADSNFTAGHSLPMRAGWFVSSLLDMVAGWFVSSLLDICCPCGLVAVVVVLMMTWYSYYDADHPDNRRM